MFSFIFYAALLYFAFFLYRLCNHLKGFYHQEKSRVDDPRRINLIPEAQKHVGIILAADRETTGLMLIRTRTFIKENPVIAGGILVFLIVIYMVNGSISSSRKGVEDSKKKVNMAFFLSGRKSADDNNKILQLCEEALKLDRTNYQAHFIKGRTFFAMKKYEEAVASFKLYFDAVKDKPQDKSFNTAYLDLAKCHLKAGRFDQSVEILETLLKKEIRDVEAENLLYNIAYYTNAKGDSAENIRNRYSNVQTFEEFHAAGLKKMKEWRYTDAAKDFDNVYRFHIASPVEGRSSNGLLKKMTASEILDKSMGFSKDIYTRMFNNVIKFVSENFDFCGEIKIQDQHSSVYSSQLGKVDAAKKIIAHSLPLSKSVKSADGELILVFRKATVVLQDKDKMKYSVPMAETEKTAIILLGCRAAQKIYSYVEVPDSYSSTDAEFEREQGEYLEISYRNRTRYTSSPSYYRRTPTASSTSSSYRGYSSSSFRSGGSSWGK